MTENKDSAIVELINATKVLNSKEKTQLLAIVYKMSEEDIGALKQIFTDEGGTKEEMRKLYEKKKAEIYEKYSSKLKQTVQKEKETLLVNSEKRLDQMDNEREDQLLREIENL